MSWHAFSCLTCICMACIMSAMKLSKYLSDTKMTDAEFAKAAGMSQSQVSRLKRAVSMPSWRTVAAIQKATGGAVTAGDFTPSSEEQAA